VASSSAISRTRLTSPPDSSVTTANEHNRM
jgi:hypothetical protein